MIEQSHPRPRLFSLPSTSWFGPLAVLGAAAITALLWRFGPPPYQEDPPSGLWPELASSATQEPTDKLILLAWWLLPVVIVIITLLAARVTPSVRPAIRSVLLALLTVGAVILIVAAVRTANDPWGYWAGLSGAALAAGVLAALGLALLWRVRRPFNAWVTWLVVAATALLAGPALAMTSMNLRDPYDFAFTGDELAAPAVGHFPLGGYTSQYINLLGYPIAPVLRLFPTVASDVVVGWILVLQVLLLAGAVALPVLVSGFRMLAPAVLLVCAPAIMAGANSPMTPLSYFANIPLRTVLPVLMIVLSVLFLPRVLLAANRWWVLALWGVAAGVVALNNADFGVPMAGVAFVALCLCSGTWRQALGNVGVALMGAVSVPVVYFLFLWLAGREVDLGAYLLFARTFAIDGFYLVPMDPFGPFIAAVGLFVSGTVIGFWLLMNQRTRRSTHRLQMALGLFMSGSWALLTMAYFAGRSFMPTFLGGAAIQVGLVAAAFLPLLRITWRRLMSTTDTKRVSIAASSVMGVVMIAVVVALLSYVRMPKDSLTDAIDSAPGRATVVNAAMLGAIDSLEGELATDGQTDPGTALLLSSGNLTQLETGRKSGMALNSPEAFTIAPAFVAEQCRHLAEISWERVAVDQDFGEYLLRNDECAALLDEAGRVSAPAGERVLWLIPRAID